MGVSNNKGPQNRPQYVMILIIRTPKEGPLIFGTPHIDIDMDVDIDMAAVCLNWGVPERGCC